MPSTAQQGMRPGRAIGTRGGALFETPHPEPNLHHRCSTVPPLLPRMPHEALVVYSERCTACVGTTAYTTDTRQSAWEVSQKASAL